MSNEYEFPIRRDEPPEEDGVVIWTNPDVPDVDAIVSGEVSEFQCPYPDCYGDPFTIEMAVDDPEENREHFVKLIEDSNGTLRCDDCDEPIFGFYGNGDH